MTIDELKQYEGQEIEYLYRGKYRPFILKAVQNTPPNLSRSMTEEEKNKYFVEGKYQGDLGDFRINYNYGDPRKREWDGFWTNKLDRIRLINNEQVG